MRQAQELLNAPDATTRKGLRDRAILAILLGCGLRRSEVAALTFGHIQQRDGRWHRRSGRQTWTYSDGTHADVDQSCDRRMDFGGRPNRRPRIPASEPAR